MCVYLAPKLTANVSQARKQYIYWQFTHIQSVEDFVYTF